MSPEQFAAIASTIGLSAAGLLVAVRRVAVKVAKARSGN